jgi:hypothetical protein
VQLIHHISSDALERRMAQQTLGRPAEEWLGRATIDKLNMELSWADWRLLSTEETAMGIGTIVLIILVILLLGGFSGIGGGPFYGTGYYGGGGLGVVIVILLVLVLLGRL